MDYVFIAPNKYLSRGWTVMIEPTEAYQELDRFCDAMIVYVKKL